MTTATLSAPVQPVQAGPVLHRFSVDEYHRMVDAGFFDKARVELLEGLVVEKRSRNPPHDYALQAVDELVTAMLPTGWCKRVQSALTLSTSEPEPDVCFPRGDRSLYRTRHPGPADVGLVVEVAESSLSDDRAKARIYAQAGIPTYWIVNLVNRQVEVYTQPSGAGANPAYGQRQDFAAGSHVPLVLAGVTVGQIAVADLLP